jgi:hypothetical protein
MWVRLPPVCAAHHLLIKVAACGRPPENLSKCTRLPGLPWLFLLPTDRRRALGPVTLLTEQRSCTREPDCKKRRRGDVRAALTCGTRTPASFSDTAKP